MRPTWWRTLVVFSFCVSICAGAVQAAPITFTHAGSGAGSINGAAFATTSFVITATGFTEDFQTTGPAHFIDHTSASISISGIGTFDFITLTRTFATANAAGFSRAGVNGADLYNGPFSSAYNGWLMDTSLGPVAGNNGILMQWDVSNVITSGGVLLFTTTAFNVTGTFQAVVGPSETPLPAALPLFATGLGALGLMTWRRKRKAVAA